MRRRPLAQRLACGLSHYDRPHLAFTCDDRKSTTSLLPTRHQQHHHTRSLHPISSQRMGGQAQWTPRQRRVETLPGTICGSRRESRKPFDRSLCVCAKPSSTTVQRRTARPDVRGGGRFSPTGLRIASGATQNMWPLLPNLVQKLRQSKATLFAPIRISKVY
jgi:hypothetical protein